MRASIPIPVGKNDRQPILVLYHNVQGSANEENEEKRQKEKDASPFALAPFLTLG
jgi:hypothetical protein